MGILSRGAKAIRRWMRRCASAAPCVLALTASPDAARANPLDGTVVGGEATVRQTAPGRLDILQLSDRAAIDWRSFSIAAGEHTHFQQPGPASVTLNRVTGPAASRIDGRLTAIGSVFLVNPNGVLFGPTAHVDVGGLLATTTDIRNEAFLAGRYSFDRPSTVSGAKVANAGMISVADRGLAALVAPEVANSGVIAAKLGKVVLAGAERFTLDLAGDGMLAFEVTEAVPGRVAQAGAIRAQGGTVLLTAGDAAGLVDGVVNMTGVVDARAVEQRGGTVVLSGGTVSLAGAIDVGGDRGGAVRLLGRDIAVEATGQIEASGSAAGGTVLIGGNWQGAGNEPHAATTRVAAGARITADGVGEGGTAVVWSDRSTRMDGRISAKRGKVETSSKGNLAIGRTAQVEAAEWLLDPRNVTIAGATAGGAFDNGSPNTFTPTADDATVDAATIATALNGGTNVLVTTGSSGAQAGHIAVNAGVTWSSAATLGLNAAGSIAINAPLTATAGNGSLSLTAGGNVTQGAGGDLRIGGATSLNLGGNVVLTNPGNDLNTVTTTAAVNLTLVDSNGIGIGPLSLTGNLTVDAGGTLRHLFGTAISVGGNVMLATTGGGIAQESFSSFTAGGNVTLAATAGDISQGFSTGITAGGNVAVSTGGGNIDLASSGIDAGGSLSASTGAGNISLQFATPLRARGGDLLLSTTAGNITEISFNSITADVGSVTLSAGTGSISQGFSSTVTAGRDAMLAVGTGSLSINNVTAGRNVALSTSSGSINQGFAAVITAGNDATLSTGAGDIAQAGFASITAGRNATLSVGTGNISQQSSATIAPTEALAVSVGSGSISQTDDAVISPGGSASLMAGGDIRLGSLRNDFGAVSASAASVALGDRNNLALGQIAAPGGLSLAALGNIAQQPGSSITAGATSFSAPSGTVTLANGGNSIASLSGLAARLDVAAQNSVAIGSLQVPGFVEGNLPGDFTLSAGGAITQQPASTLFVGTTAVLSAGNGGITQGAGATIANPFGTTSLATAGDIVLASPTNVFRTVSATGNNITLANSSDLLILDAISAAGNFSVFTQGGVTAGSIAVGGNSFFGSLTDLLLVSSSISLGPTAAIEQFGSCSVIVCDAQSPPDIGDVARLTLRDTRGAASLTDTEPGGLLLIVRDGDSAGQGRMRQPEMRRRFDQELDPTSITYSSVGDWELW